MKSLLKVLLAFVVIALMTYIGNKSFGIIGAIVAFVCTIFVIIGIKRADFMYGIGFFQYCKGNYNVAFNLMKSAYKTTKLSPHKTISYSYYLIREGRIEEADVVLNKVTYLKKRELSPADLMNSKINRSLVLWKQDKLDKAIELLEECHKENLVSTTLYGTLGYFYILNNQLTKALEYNKQAFEYNSDNAVIADNLAYNYILFGEFEKAEEIYKKILVAKPQFIEPYYNYALLLEKRMQIKEAIEYYKKALQFSEKYLSVIKHSDINEAIKRIEGGVITLDTVLENSATEDEKTQYQSEEIANSQPDEGNE